MQVSDGKSDPGFGPVLSSKTSAASKFNRPSAAFDGVREVPQDFSVVLHELVDSVPVCVCDFGLESLELRRAHVSVCSQMSGAVRVLAAVSVALP